MSSKGGPDIDDPSGSSDPPKDQRNNRLLSNLKVPPASASNFIGKANGTPVTTKRNSETANESELTGFMDRSLKRCEAKLQPNRKRKAEDLPADRQGFRDPPPRPVPPPKSSSTDIFIKRPKRHSKMHGNDYSFESSLQAAIRASLETVSRTFIDLSKDDSDTEQEQEKKSTTIDTMVEKKSKETVKEEECRTVPDSSTVKTSSHQNLVSVPVCSKKRNENQTKGDEVKFLSPTMKLNEASGDSAICSDNSVVTAVNETQSSPKTPLDTLVEKTSKQECHVMPDTSTADTSSRQRKPISLPKWWKKLKAFQKKDEDVTKVLSIRTTLTCLPQTSSNLPVRLPTSSRTSQEMCPHPTHSQM
jgi:hypothetical protein